MRDKIYENREVLGGLSILTALAGGFYKFKIIYVNEKGIKISLPISYADMGRSAKSVESVVKDAIQDSNSNPKFSLSRKAFLSQNKLKKTPIIIDDVRFQLDNITNSSLSLDKLISYDELEKCGESGFLSTIKRNVSRNLLENPPKPEKRKSYSHYGYDFTTPYLFDSFSNGMNFRQPSHRRTVVSEEELERNRIKYKEANEAERIKREKMEKLDKELGLDKKRNTRDLVRMR